MKNTFITIIVLVLIGLGVFVFAGKNNSEAPVLETESEGGAVSNTMPVLGSEGEGVPEMIVNESEGVKEFTVDGKNFSFTANVINVKKGDLVKITFKNSQGFHDLVIDEFKAATKQIKTGEQETISFIADKAGSFEYYCSVGTHRALGMTGTLVVSE